MSYGQKDNHRFGIALAMQHRTDISIYGVNGPQLDINNNKK